MHPVIISRLAQRTRRRTTPAAPSPGPTDRDNVALVYNAGTETDDWQPLNGHTINDGTSIVIAAIVNYGAGGVRTTALSDNIPAPSTAGSRMEWYFGDPAAGGTPVTYGANNTPRLDDTQPPYDPRPGASITAAELGGPGSWIITARCVYPDGTINDHKATLNVGVPPLTISAGPSASPSTTSAVIQMTTSTQVNAVTVEHRVVGAGTWTQTPFTPSPTFTPSVTLTGLSASTNYEYRIQNVTDVHTQSVQDLTVRTFATTATAPPPSTSDWPGDVAIPAGFPNSKTTGLPDGWTPTTTINGNYTVPSNTTLEDALITGTLTVGAGATVRRCRIEGNLGPTTEPQDIVGFTGSNHLLEDCDIGPDVNLCVLAAPIVRGQTTCDIDHNGTPFVTTGFPVAGWNVAGGGHTYLMFCQESTGKEQYRTIGKTDLGSGIWRYSLGEEYGDPPKYGWTGGSTGWRNNWSGFRFNHAAGRHISYFRYGVDPALAGNAVKGGNETMVRRCNIHGGGDGYKMGEPNTNTYIEDSYIHDFWYANAKHNDGVQAHRSGINNVVHCTIDGTLETTNAIRFADLTTHCNGVFCYVNGSWSTGTYNHSVNSGTAGNRGVADYNRFGPTINSPGGSFSGSPAPDSVKDNRYAWSGNTGNGTTVSAGTAVAGGTVNGGTDGTAGRWATGYDTHPFWQAHFGHPDGTPTP